MNGRVFAHSACGPELLSRDHAIRLEPVLSFAGEIPANRLDKFSPQGNSSVSLLYKRSYRGHLSVLEHQHVSSSVASIVLPLPRFCGRRCRPREPTTPSRSAPSASSTRDW